MNNGTWVRTKKASEFYGVTPDTIRRWANNGQVEFKRTINNQRLFNIGKRMETENTPIRTNYIYVRVSSNKQRDDLQRQKEFLSTKYPDYKVIKDIGSGLNFKRPGLFKLLELSRKGLVDTIVISSKDRLCRFGFELIKWELEKSNVKLMVLDSADKSPEQEFTEDILAILQVFACRWNGKRKYSIQNKKNKITLDINTEKAISEME